ALDEIEPRAAGRREMHVVARPLSQPAADGGGLVRGVVVENKMHGHVARHSRLDRVQESPEFARAVSRMAFANYTTGAYVEGGKQSRRAVAHGGVGVALRLSRTQRQHGGAPIKGLNLGLLVDAEDQGAIGRLEIQTDDIAHLLDEQRVFRQFERFSPMRLEREGAAKAPDPTFAA